MIYALQRLQASMRTDLEKYGIELRPEENAIIYRDMVMKLPNYTETRVCKRIINEKIKDAKAREAARIAARQTNLLEGL